MYSRYIEVQRLRNHHCHGYRDTYSGETDHRMTVQWYPQGDYHNKVTQQAKQ